MKLTEEQVDVVRQELGAEPIESDNPALESLVGAFGDHSFYVGADGLFVIEEADVPDHPGSPARLILVASWTDDNRNALKPIQPVPTGMIVDLAAPLKGNGADSGADGLDEDAD